MSRNVEVQGQAMSVIRGNHQLALCRPVYYEVLRGLLWRNATVQLSNLQHNILPLFSWIELEDSDWEQAAYFWADARRKGQQLSDSDLLLAAIAYRLSAILVSNDADFDILSVQRENWRK